MWPLGLLFFMKDRLKTHSHDPVVQLHADISVLLSKSMIVFFKIFIDRDHGLDFFFHNTKWRPRQLDVCCREDILFYIFIYTFKLIKPPLYVKFVKSYAQSPWLEIKYSYVFP
jgi:hypothetical protein